MTIIGIDPGLDGGIAIINPPQTPEGTLNTQAMPTIETTKGKGKSRTLDAIKLTWIFRDAGHPIHVHVFVERVHAMPKQGVASTFKFGVVYGQILGVLAGMGYGYELVTPQTWMKAVMPGYAKGKNGKKPSVQWVQQKYPGIDLRANDRCKKPHDGIADAICIAEYGRRIIG